MVYTLIKHLEDGTEDQKCFTCPEKAKKAFYDSNGMAEELQTPTPELTFELHNLVFQYVPEWDAYERIS
jgi:hypothetical protein